MIVDEEMNKWNFEFEQAIVIMSTNLTVACDRKQNVRSTSLNFLYEESPSHYQ